MTRNQLYQILRNYVGRDAEAMHAVGEIWGEPFDGETEKINTAKSASSTSERKLELAYTAIRVAVAEFEQVNWGWDGDCGSRNIIARLEMSLPTPTQPQ